MALALIPPPAMPTTRRMFLRRGALVATLPLLTGPATGAAPRPRPEARQGPTGLLFDREDLPRLRANLAHPRLRSLRERLWAVDHAGELRFLREELRLTNRVSDMARARRLIEESAFAYAVWERPPDLELARTALRRILDYPTWDYFTEGGDETIGLQRAPEATIAVCCALDWIGPALDPEEIVAAERDLAAKGAPACYRTLYGMKYPDRVRGWGFSELDDFPFRYDLSRWPLILNSTNLKVIPTCALGFAAVWLHGRHPEAGKWLEMSRQSARAFGVMYGLDGSYDEGIGYWGYTTLHLAMQAEVLHRRLGIDDRGLINYPGTIRYALHMSMPTLGAPVTNPHETTAYTATPKGTLDPALDTINLGDSGTGGVEVTVAAWVGRVTGDPLARHLAHAVGAMKHLPAAIWFEPEAPGAPPGPELFDVRMSNDWVVSRTGWEARDTVVFLRSGGPANHEHADRNSVLFKARGERLFHDPFKASYVPSHPLWRLRLTEAHTALLIDGEGHQYHDGREGTNASWATAEVRAYATGPGWMTVTSEAAPAYALVNDAVRRVERSLVFLKPDVLLLLDRVQLDPSRPAAVQARFQVYNEDGEGHCSASAGGFAITRPHAALAATVHSPAPATLTPRADQHPLPADAGVFPFVEVESARAAEHTLLTVAAARPANGPAPTVEVTWTDGGWSLTVTQEGRSARVRIDPRGELPGLTVS
jgi:hypothetical protein